MYLIRKIFSSNLIQVFLWSGVNELFQVHVNEFKYQIQLRYIHYNILQAKQKHKLLD